MWISQRTFESLLTERAAAVGAHQALERTMISLSATMDWLKFRLTQVEHERAILMENFMGVKVPVPVIEDERPKRGTEHLLNDASALFRDIGDEEALKQGIGWDETGELAYSGPK